MNLYCVKSLDVLRMEDRTAEVGRGRWRPSCPGPCSSRAAQSRLPSRLSFFSVFYTGVIYLNVSMFCIFKGIQVPISQGFIVVKKYILTSFWMKDHGKFLQ